MPPRLLRSRARQRALASLVLVGAMAGGVAAAEASSTAESAPVVADRWAHDYSASDYATRLAALDGQDTGVGLRLRIDRNRLVVADVDRGSPAERAGVRAGERVVEVGGHPVGASDLPSVVRDLRRGGAAATVAGPSGVRDVALDAVERPAQAVTVHQLPAGVRHIQVEAMVRGAAGSVDELLTDRTADPTSGVILDLRGNGGGLVTAAVDLAAVFVEQGPGVAYPRPDGSLRSVDVPGSGGVVTAPMVVLVDGATASAAEIAAGILQDRGRAIVIGSTTFGKGTVQEPSVSPDGSVSERTVGRYVLPSGRQIDGQGIRPDVVVDAHASEDTVMTVATSVLHGLAPLGHRGR